MEQRELASDAVVHRFTGGCPAPPLNVTLCDQVQHCKLGGTVSRAWELHAAFTLHLTVKEASSCGGSKSRAQRERGGGRNAADAGRFKQHLSSDSTACVQVKNVAPASAPAMSVYNEKINGSVMEYRSTNGDVQAYPEDNYGSHPMPEEVFPLKNNSGISPKVYSSSSDTGSRNAPRKKQPEKAKLPTTDFEDPDYATGGESCDELDDDDWDSEYPPITSDNMRQEYKKDFDTGLQEYRRLQAELDDVTKVLAQLDKELDEHPVDSAAYKSAAAEYNRLKDIKSSPEFRNKKKYCKQMKNKLNHIKRRVSNYDNNI